MYCRITRSPIDPLELLRRVRTDSDGAVVVFTGVVRNHDAGRAVERLTYEAYEAMAEERLREICSAVAAAYEIGDVAAVHRVGELEIGDVSVVVAVAAPHREPAFRACREVIERVKREVPIWKRERYAGGDEAWLEGTPPAGAGPA